MATYYVDYLNGNDTTGTGATGLPWKTPAKALTVVANGDTVKFRGMSGNSATWYPTPWTASVAGVTWTNDGDHTPTWDGNYNRNGTTYTLGSARPGSLYDAMLTVKAANCTFSGLRFQNVGGEGISIGENCDNTTITNCVVNMTYGSSIVVNAARDNLVADIEISYSTFTHSSYALLSSDDNGGTGSQQKAGNAVMLQDCQDLWFHHNTVAWSMKEGINVDKAGVRTIIEYNTIHSINHSGIYVNRTVECDIRHNTIHHTKNRTFLGTGYGKRTAPPGIKIGDELEAGKTMPANSSKQRVYNNLVVGAGKCLIVSNNTSPSGYDTQLNQAYIGFNTFIGEAWTDANGVSKTENVIEILGNENGKPHTKTIFENNLIYAPTGVKLGKITGASGIAFRNNCWYSASGESAPAVARSNSDVTASPRIVAPEVHFTDPYPAITGTGFNVENYRLTSASPCIGAASNMSRVNELTPPTITTDLVGATRNNKDATAGEYFDIGALEYGAGDGGGGETHTVTANFTQSATQGDAPLSVVFNDTSTVGGSASIDAYEWDYGDGVTSTTAADPHTYIYATPGTYTPKLKVWDTTRNLSHTKTGTAIVVTTSRVIERPGVMDVIRTTMPTSGTEKTLLFNLNDNAPALVLFFLTKCTTVGTAVDGAMLSYGAATAAAQWCLTLESRDNQAISDTYKRSTSIACVEALDGGAVVGSAKLKEFRANRATLTVTNDFPTGYMLTAVAFAGTQYNAKASSFGLGVQNEVAQLFPGFRPELYFLGGNVTDGIDAVENGADFQMGWADGTNQYGFSWRDTDGDETTRTKARLTTTRAISSPINAASAGFTDYDAGKLTVFGNDIGRRHWYAALDVPSDTSIATATFSSPTSTGSQSYSLGIEPAGILILASSLGKVDAHDTGVGSEGFAIVAVDRYATYGTAIASDTAQATSNTKSIATDNLRVIDGAGTTILAGTVTLDADGFDINWTTVQSTPRHFMVMGISSTAAIAGPIAEFEADDTTPDAGTVQFTDLSNANGSAITAWAWTFGDGKTSTEQNPEHTYNQPGTYAVSLTVTNANGSATRTKAAYIKYVLADEWLGVYWPRSVTNTSTNTLYGNDELHPYYGDEEHELDLDGLEIDEYPEDTTYPSSKPGKARIVMDKANQRLLIIWPDGTGDSINFD